MMPSSAQNEKLCFYLDAEYHPEFNMVTLSLECGGGSFAGALLEIVYDDSFSFTSVKSDFLGLEFSCSLSDTGVIRVLFDGTENSYCEGRLALFCFSLCSAESSGTFSFELRCPDEEAIYGIDDGEFYTVKNELFGAFVDIPNIIYEAEHPKYVGFYQKEGAVCFVVRDGVTAAALRSAR